jgi:hypothetical protein
MKTKIFALAALIAVLAAFSKPASAGVVIVYRQFYGPRVYTPAPIYQPVPEYVPVPVVAFDPGARYSGAYDIQGVVTSAVPYHLTVRIMTSSFRCSSMTARSSTPQGRRSRPA